jgi:hypothetical protein
LALVVLSGLLCNSSSAVFSGTTTDAANTFSLGTWLYIDTSVAPANGTGTVTTAAFNTSMPDTLVAFVSSDGPSGAGQQTVTVSGAGLTWTLAKRTNSQSGDAEIWTATSATPLNNVTVKSTPSSGGYNQALTVVAFAHAAGVGATASGAASTGAPTVSVTTTAALSWVYAVGHDWDQAIARTTGSNQTIVSQWVNTSTGDTAWVQSTTTPTAPAGTLVTLNDTSPTTDRWDLAAIEITSS